MRATEIAVWLRYWKAANMVNVDAITTPELVAVARRFCAVMRTGIFTEVTDAEIWVGLCEVRAT